jgi:hypothetical protein
MLSHDLNNLHKRMELKYIITREIISIVYPRKIEIHVKISCIKDINIP